MTNAICLALSRSAVPLGFAMLAAMFLGQRVEAQLIAYEPFDYDPANATDGDLVELGAGTLGDASGSGWVAGEGWFDTRTSDFEKAGNHRVASNPTGWGYTDSNGKSLPISGNTAYFTNWDEEARRFDLSGVDPSKLRRDSTDQLDVLGVGGSEIWISFLAQKEPGAAVKNQASIQVGVSGGTTPPPDTPKAAKKIGIGAPYNGDGADVWGLSDYRVNDAPTISTQIPVQDKVFMVTRIQFSDDGPYGDDTVSSWINPDLGATAPTVPADPNNTPGFATVLARNFDFNSLALQGVTKTFIDEIRVGWTYADVAPIASVEPGLLADFNEDDKVDGADFLAWQQGFGTAYDATDLTNFQDEYGSSLAGPPTSAVPEPSALILAGAMTFALGSWRRR